MSIDPEFATVVIKLLKGPLYNEDPDWSTLILIQGKVRDYLGVLGLELNLYDVEGFAFLSQPDTEESENIPRLISRRRISFEATLLCVILREELDRFELSNSESSKLYIEKNEIRERIRIYFKERTDETRLFNDLNKYINQVENMGFLKKVRTGMQGKNELEDNEIYEVRYIIKAKIDLSFLADFKSRMEVYVNAL
ncbi:MAG: DUF4194 domain-containing protein [Spirochaetales bacterium]|nr:DUF4194 domain-containing protein [Spirochaetales bacterium]